MQQERNRQEPISSHKPGRQMVWLVVLGFGVLLIPIEYFIVTNSRAAFFLLFLVSTLSSFFVVGGLCAFITTRRLESGRVVDFLLRGGENGLYTGLFNVLLVLVFLLINGIYNIYHSEYLAARMLRPTWGLLVLGLLVFLAAGCFHAIVACLGGMLGGLCRGWIASNGAANRDKAIAPNCDPYIS